MLSTSGANTCAASTINKRQDAERRFAGLYTCELAFIIYVRMLQGTCCWLQTLRDVNFRLHCEMFSQVSLWSLSPGDRWWTLQANQSCITKASACFSAVPCLSLFEVFMLVYLICGTRNQCLWDQFVYYCTTEFSFRIEYCTTCRHHHLVFVVIAIIVISICSKWLSVFPCQFSALIFGLCFIDLTLSPQVSTIFSAQTPSSHFRLSTWTLSKKILYIDFTGN